MKKQKTCFILLILFAKQYSGYVYKKEWKKKKNFIEIVKKNLTIHVYNGIFYYFDNF